MAHLPAPPVEQRMPVPQIPAIPFFSPGLAAGLCGALRDRARHLPRARASDLSACGAIGHDALD